jgi:hypothetical protein
VRFCGFDPDLTPPEVVACLKSGTHAGRLTALSEFVEEAKSSGLVATSIEHAGLRAMQVAPPHKHD